MNLKICCNCGENKPLNEYFISKQTNDGHWHWCKKCEEKARKQDSDYKHILSFSGGKDSTALLILLLEKKFPLDKIVYFDCEEFEFPEMLAHIEKVKKMFNIEIEVCKTVKPWLQYLKELGWASPWLRWCTNEKINSIRRKIRFHRPHIQYIGYAADEVKRINRALSKNKKRKRDYFSIYNYPLVNYGITEKRALEICYANGFDFGGLYDYWDRVSCWCCPLQSNTDLQKLREVRPELYKKLWELNDLCPDKHKWGNYKH